MICIVQQCVCIIASIENSLSENPIPEQLNQVNVVYIEIIVAATAASECERDKEGDKMHRIK